MRRATANKRTYGDLANLIPPDEVLFGRSPAMAPVRKRAEKICQTNIPVLLCGDAGTGKETVARWIHGHSPYCNGQFVKVNCAAIPGSLLESELFGYEKGAFTQASISKPGRVELAHRGSLFLDEITDLDLTLQSKLLQFLQDGSFSRIGDESERVVETRLVCSTNKGLEREIDRGKFRADLFYRISVMQLHLPRLRERREDIPVLAEYFRNFYEEQFSRESEPFGAEMIRYFQKLSWPGNVRELANGIARYVLIGPEAALGQEKLLRSSDDEWMDPAGSGHSVPLRRIATEAIRETERRIILETLQANQWNRRKTAQALKISYRALIYKIRDAGLASSRIVPNSSRSQSPVRLPITSND
jgi:two-component system, NtrC family, response regulator AtoC